MIFFKEKKGWTEIRFKQLLRAPNMQNVDLSTVTVALIQLGERKIIVAEFYGQSLTALVKRCVVAHRRFGRFTYCAEVAHTKCILATSPQVSSSYTKQPTVICPAQSMHSMVWCAESCGCSATMMRVHGPLKQLPIEIWRHVMNYL